MFKLNTISYIVYYRNIKSNDLDLFSSFISEYISIDNILNTFAPLKNIFPNPSSPWYNSKVYNLKINLRKLEKGYLHEPNSINIREFKNMRLIYRKSLLSSKDQFLSG